MLIQNREDRKWVLRQNFKGGKPEVTTYTMWRYQAVVNNLSLEARQRLEWFVFFYTIANRNNSLTASYFGIARKTFHKWKRRFDPTNIFTLEQYSRAPRKRRQWTVTYGEERNIRELREKHMKWGKKKLKVVYKRAYGVNISTNKIQKVISRYSLYPDPVTHKRKLKRRVKRRDKTYINTFEKKKELGFLWHTDSVIIWWYGARRVIFTAVEECTRIAYARAYTTNSSKNAKDFLQRLLYLANHQVQHIHHDNGSEFYGQFEQACKEMGIQQIFSRVRTPKDNPALERFNWTVQDEWLSLSPYGLDDIDIANRDLTDWLVEYNSVRPHNSLDNMTPIEYATKMFEVSPMW
ncbi:integrase core domain-containing protein, partial [Patescibacteria group bacterium]|nr:integrase core domain-containing protein [Patescibacteria group bacterium]